MRNVWLTWSHRGEATNAPSWSHEMIELLALLPAFRRKNIAGTRPVATETDTNSLDVAGMRPIATEQRTLHARGLLQLKRTKHSVAHKADIAAHKEQNVCAGRINSARSNKVQGILAELMKCIASVDLYCMGSKRLGRNISRRS